MLRRLLIVHTVVAAAKLIIEVADPSTHQIAVGYYAQAGST